MRSELNGYLVSVFKKMFCIQCFIYLTCLCMLYMASEENAQFFNRIIVKVYRKDIPVTLKEVNTINNEYEATEVIIEDEAIPVLKTGTFYNLTELKYIFLQGNGIQKLEPYAFKDLPKLRVINLNFNHIFKIPKNVFIDLPLTKLYLKGNGIETLERFAFKNLTFLETLDLSSNNIEVLPKNLFYFTKNLKTINLSYNRLKEQDIGTHILLYGYFEEAFSNNVIYEDSVLDLSNNKFTHINSFLFQGIICLKEILLANNNITSIHDYAFVYLKYIDFLDLEANNLEKLSEAMLNKFEQIEYVNLANNPWNMDFVCKYEEWCIDQNKTNTIDANCTSDMS